jgi:hypothetical protein
VLRRIRARVVAPFVLAACAALGCGDVDGGSQPFAGTTLYLSSAGDYEMRLLEPPWLPLTLNGVTVFLVWPNDTISGEPQESDALYSLHVTSVEGDPAAALALAAVDHTASFDLSRRRPVRTLSGAVGFELPWQEGPGVYHRDVFVAAAGTRTYFLHFTGKQPLGDDAGVTQMILSFRPHATMAAGGTGGEA